MFNFYSRSTSCLPISIFKICPSPILTNCSTLTASRAAAAAIPRSPIPSPIPSRPTPVRAVPAFTEKDAKVDQLWVCLRRPRALFLEPAGGNDFPQPPSTGYVQFQSWFALVRGAIPKTQGGRHDCRYQASWPGYCQFWSTPWCGRYAWRPPQLFLLVFFSAFFHQYLLSLQKRWWKAEHKYGWRRLPALHLLINSICQQPVVTKRRQYPLLPPPAV